MTQVYQFGPFRLDAEQGLLAPSRASDPEFRRWWAKYLRLGASPDATAALTRMHAEVDMRNVLPSIRVPALVIHRPADRCLGRWSLYEVV